MVDVNLTGAWNTAKAAVPYLKANPGGGSITLTSSVGGLMGLGNLSHYVSAKHGLVGLMRTLALELAPNMIRVNTINPTSVLTDMLTNPSMFEVFAPDMAPEERTLESLSPRFMAMHALPIPYVESVDVSNALLFLASDEARYITGITLPVDGGVLLK